MNEENGLKSKKYAIHIVNNTGKVNFDGFKAIIQLGIENMKKEGKL